jgi:prepilin-type N-terminal cleavage/methylation domain-containing protein
MHPTSPAALARSDDTGFTLIELLIALVISGIIATIIFQVLLGEGRFARVQTAREEVQQNARAALEVITSELRGIGPDAILEATRTSIKFEVPRAWGLVCGYPDPAGGPRSLAVIFPSSAVATLATNGTDRLAVPPVGKDADGNQITYWRFLSVNDVTGQTSGMASAVAECTKFSPDPPLVTTPSAWKSSRARLFTSTATDEVPDELTVGDPVYVADPPVRYATGTSSPGNEIWIKRSHGSGGAMQPLAGPVPAEGGLTFAYFNGAGEDITSALASGTAEPSSIRRIVVNVVTLSRAQFSGTPQRESATATVFPRNRI